MSCEDYIPERDNDYDENEHGISFEEYLEQSMNDDIRHVHAYEMTDTQFKYKCSCKHRRHTHGNSGDPFKNRREFRTSHCPQDDRDLCIHITDKTVRRLKSTN